MRISNNMMTNNYLYSLNNALERQTKIQEQLADGKAIHRPSDDPIKAIRALRFNSNLGMNEQYTQNVKDATSWMETTDGALQDISSITIRAKELVIQAIAPNTSDGFEAIGKEIDGIISQLVQVGNTKLGDRYVFAGQKDKTEPFQVIKDATSGLVARVVYQGDANKISMPLQPGLADPSKDSVNLTGTELFGPVVTLPPGDPNAGDSITFLNDLIAVRDQLLTGNPDLTYLSNTGLDNIDAGKDTILRSHTTLGARMATYEMTQSLLEGQNIIITGDVANNEDVDVSRTLIDFTTSENVYKAALAIGARIMPPSLVDFLR